MQIVLKTSKSEQSAGAEHTIINSSMHPLLPVLSKFHFIGSHLSVDIYASRWLKFMLVLFLEFSKSLKGFFSHIIGNTERRNLPPLTFRQ